MNRHEQDERGQFAFGFAKTISTEQAATRLKTTSQTIRKLLRDKKLRGYQLQPGVAGSPWCVFTQSVDRYIDMVNEMNELGPYGSPER